MPDTTNHDEREDFDVSFDFEITRVRGRESAGGKWVSGRLSGHRFDALVFAQHAEVESYELGQSQISKLWLQRLNDKTEVANFDRGWDVQPKTDEAAAIVDYLAAGLADMTFPANA